MSQERTAEAFVLKRSDSGESDRRLTLLTREYGKVDVIAKGARKSGSRLAGSSEPLVKGIYTFAEGRARRFLTSVQPLTSNPAIRADYDRLVAALAWAELMLTVLPYESPEEDHYDLFSEVLHLLEKHENWRSAYVWGAAKLLLQEGNHPDWLACVATGESALTRPCYVSPMAGGRVDSSSLGKWHDVIEVSPEAIIALARLNDLAEPPKTFATIEEVMNVQFQLWRSILEKPLKAYQGLVYGS